MKRMLIAGGTGLIGRAITAHARAAGWTVDILSRTPGEGRIPWDPATGTIRHEGLQAYDAIVNLAGAPVAQRWTATHRKRVIESRLDAANTLARHLADGRLKTAVYVGASAVGYYGDTGSVTVTEETPPGDATDWMAWTVDRWESGHAQVAALGIRTIILRIGIVLSRDGGAFQKMLMTSPFGFLTTFGTGKAFMPWIHIDDIAEIFLWATTQPQATGTYLACAPQAVTNAELVRLTARASRGFRLVLPVPRFALALVLGKMHRVLFDSCRGFPARLLRDGYVFRFAEAGPAIDRLIKG
jgi:uncharacterized protein (TIGR01777 family)